MGELFCVAFFTSANSARDSLHRTVAFYARNSEFFYEWNKNAYLLWFKKLRDKAKNIYFSKIHCYPHCTSWGNKNSLRLHNSNDEYSLIRAHELYLPDPHNLSFSYEATFVQKIPSVGGSCFNLVPQTRAKYSCPFSVNLPLNTILWFSKIPSYYWIMYTFEYVIPLNT